MSLLCSRLAAISIAAIFIIICHLTATAPAATTMGVGRQDEIHQRVHVLNRRANHDPTQVVQASSQDDDEGDDENDDYEEDEDTGGHIAERNSVPMGYKIVILVLPDDLYVENRCQTFSMFSSISCNEDDQNRIFPVKSQFKSRSQPQADVEQTTTPAASQIDDATSARAGLVFAKIDIGGLIHDLLGGFAQHEVQTTTPAASQIDNTISATKDVSGAGLDISRMVGNILGGFGYFKTF
ncbi:uncharacterized protein LOC132200795 isoform X2 [Neocloeon triangulifer]|uniref:uncharacterized protein LOC132200795 isoform X2 n=1 Tax=Neocloeon triangulifer TaxID=2078957 RepID=UPI00286F789D|nr:uncharacterized protein LOC132200795 isoform X2 [Neocloeon triangulifer]